MISNFMSGTAPLSIPSTHPHHTKASGVSDPKDPSDPNVCDNLPCALLPKPATPRARCATPPSVPAPHNCPPETPTQNSVLYLSRCGSLPACQSASSSVQTLAHRAQARHGSVASSRPRNASNYFLSQPYLPLQRRRLLRFDIRAHFVQPHFYFAPRNSIGRRFDVTALHQVRDRISEPTAQTVHQRLHTQLDVRDSRRPTRKCD